MKKASNILYILGNLLVTIEMIIFVSFAIYYAAKTRVAEIPSNTLLSRSYSSLDEYKDAAKVLSFSYSIAFALLLIIFLMSLGVQVSVRRNPGYYGIHAILIIIGIISLNPLFIVGGILGVKWTAEFNKDNINLEMN